MKLVYNSKYILLFIAIMAMPILTWADESKIKSKEQFTKVIEKKFDISVDGTTRLYNKYGHINIQTWDKNKVELKITIKANAKTEAKADELFERIDIDITNGSDYVKAETLIESSSKWGNWTKGDYKIYYDVRMPIGNSLEASMKYGNLNVESLSGAADVEVKYGNLQLEAVGGKSKVSVAYGNGSIQHAKDLTAHVSYGKLTIHEAEDVNMHSKYSRVVIEEAEDVNVESKYDTYDIEQVREFRNVGKYDNFRIEEVGDVSITSKYSHFKVDELHQSADINCAWGGATISDIQSGFSGVNLVGNYAIFKLGFDDNAKYQFQATGENAKLGDFTTLKLNQELRDPNAFNIMGYKGTIDTYSKVKAKLKYGSIKILD